MEKHKYEHEHMNKSENYAKFLLIWQDTPPLYLGLSKQTMNDQQGGRNPQWQPITSELLWPGQRPVSGRAGGMEPVSQ